MFVRVVELDGLAAEDVLDFLAGDRVQRLDPPRVHHGQLADLVIGRAFTQDPDFGDGPEREIAGKEKNGQGQT